MKTEKDLKIKRILHLSKAVKNLSQLRDCHINTPTARIITRVAELLAIELSVVSNTLNNQEPK